MEAFSVSSPPLLRTLLAGDLDSQGARINISSINVPNCGSAERTRVSAFPSALSPTMPPFTHTSMVQKPKWTSVACGNHTFAAAPPVDGFQYPKHSPAPPRQQRLLCVAQFRGGDRALLTGSGRTTMVVDIVRVELADKALPPYPLSDQPEAVYLVKEHSSEYSPLRGAAQQWVHGSQLQAYSRGHLSSRSAWSHSCPENSTKTFDQARRPALKEQQRATAKETAEPPNLSESLTPVAARPASARASLNRSLKVTWGPIPPNSRPCSAAATLSNCHGNSATRQWSSNACSIRLRRGSAHGLLTGSAAKISGEPCTPGLNLLLTTPATWAARLPPTIQAPRLRRRGT